MCVRVLVRVRVKLMVPALKCAVFHLFWEGTKIKQQHHTDKVRSLILMCKILYKSDMTDISAFFYTIAIVYPVVLLLTKVNLSHSLCLSHCQAELRGLLNSLHSFCIVCQSCLSVGQNDIRNQVRLFCYLELSLVCLNLNIHQISP